MPRPSLITSHFARVVSPELMKLYKYLPYYSHKYYPMCLKRWSHYVCTKFDNLVYCTTRDMTLFDWTFANLLMSTHVFKHLNMCTTFMDIYSHNLCAQCLIIVLYSTVSQRLQHQSYGLWIAENLQIYSHIFCIDQRIIDQCLWNIGISLIFQTILITCHIVSI